MPSKPIMIRMDDETKTKAEQQASKLGLNISGYVRLIINLDVATNIIEQLRKSE